MELIVNEKGTIIKVVGEVEDNVVLPDSANRIAKNLFNGNNNLKEVIMSDNLKYIGEKSFFNCHNLTSVHMPSVLQIDNFAFSNCKCLKNISLPNTLLSIKENAFSGCKSIESIVIPSNIKEIEKSTFDSCDNLFKIELPPSLIFINERSFANCTKLNKIYIPSSVREIGEYAFLNCSSVEYFDLPKSLISIKKNAFEKCSSLRKVILKENVEEIAAGCFNQCYNLKEIRMSNYSNMKQPGIAMLNHYTYYIDNKTEELILSTENKENYRELDYKEIGKMLSINSKYNSILASIMFSKDDLQNKEIKSISFLINDLLNEDININNYKDIKKSLYNSKEFINVLKHINFYSNYEAGNKESKLLMETKMYGLFKFAYTIGAFSENYKERQKSCEFIKNLYDKQILTNDNVYGLFNRLKFRKFNPEVARFVMNKDNFEKMVGKSNDFLLYTLNDFEKIREYCRSNKGDQRYLMVTLEMASKFREKRKFEGVDQTNVDLSEVIGKYTFDQSVFGEAASIRSEYLKRRAEGLVSDHILEDVNSCEIFDHIEKLKNNITQDIGDVMSDLNKISNNKFTFEYLSKYDPNNFVLGKYCSCCSHLESVGYSIVKASILHPDCQNLVIKNNQGRIIAKSTLYINRSQGYGVFNNVEINTTIKNEKDIRMIYECYLKAVNQFAYMYNQKYPNNPLKQINVGMDNNDLGELLNKNHIKETNLLEGLNFTQFGKVNQLHSGDWQHDQRILWKKEDVMEDKNNGR